ncbi:hypothetical protein BHM03_00037064, partial [Ensete ventricosum]
KGKGRVELATRNRGRRSVVEDRVAPTPRHAPPRGLRRSAYVHKKNRGRAWPRRTRRNPWNPPPPTPNPDFGFILARNPRHSVPGRPYTSIYMAGAWDLAVSRGWGLGWTVAGEGQGSGVRAVAFLDPSARCRVPVPLQVGLRPRTNPVFVLFWLN